MKLDFNFQIKDLDGNEVRGALPANKLLGHALSQMNRGNSIKLYDWALRLWRGEILELEDSDADVLKSIIDTSDQIYIIAKIPLMDVIKKEQKRIEAQQEKAKQQIKKK